MHSLAASAEACSREVEGDELFSKTWARAWSKGNEGDGLGFSQLGRARVVCFESLGTNALHLCSPCAKQMPRRCVLL